MMGDVVGSHLQECMVNDMHEHYPSLDFCPSSLQDARDMFGPKCDRKIGYMSKSL